VLVRPDDAQIVRESERVGRYRRGVWRILTPVVGVVGLLAGTASARPSDDLPHQQLAFARAGNVLTIAADGTGARLLLRNAYAPAWSPDGSRLAFVSRRSGDEEIYVARADGASVERLTRSPGPDLSPAWSSDGRRIAFSRRAEIWTMRADGSLQRPLVRKAKAWHEHYTPTWHGRTIVYSSNRVPAFNPELYAAPARRLTLTKVSDGVLGDDGMPDFSPNGRRIVFTALPGTIVVMDADGTGRRQVTVGTDPDWRPASP
jgi:Tol biopolymer transport system component